MILQLLGINTEYIVVHSATMDMNMIEVKVHSWL